VSQGGWVRELQAEVMTCDREGIILEMNDQAELLFAGDGGRCLVGQNVLDCHPEPARSKLAAMLMQPVTNAYLETENGEKRFFFQAPWYRQGTHAGCVEISFEVPENIPNYIKD
jgi:transcriptional regulator with PAS, ATPase and Fis domain